MADAIKVRQTGQSDPMLFDVTVGGAMDEKRCRVTCFQKDYIRLAGTQPPPPDRFIEAAFRFLLDREPKEAILSQFDINVIPRYFPDFETKLGTYLAADGS